jgi:hypothetical protein
VYLSEPPALSGSTDVGVASSATPATAKRSTRIVDQASQTAQPKETTPNAGGLYGLLQPMPILPLNHRGARALKEAPRPSDLEQTPRHWLYALTEADARWLDEYGYPTPEEDSKLRAMSSDALLKLALEGNQNARVHYALDLYRKAWESNDRNKIIDAERQLRAAQDVGPYQAAVVGEAMHEIVLKFKDMPKTPENREYRNQVGSFLEISAAISNLFGDQQVVSEMIQSGKGNHIRNLERNERPADSFWVTAGRNLSLMFVNRESFRAPPITVTPRDNTFRHASKSIFIRQ